MKLHWLDIGQIVAITDDGEEWKVVADVFDVVGEELVTRYNAHATLLSQNAKLREALSEAREVLYDPVMHYSEQVWQARRIIDAALAEPTL